MLRRMAGNCGGVASGMLREGKRGSLEGKMNFYGQINGAPTTQQTDSNKSIAASLIIMLSNIMKRVYRKFYTWGC